MPNSGGNKPTIPILTGPTGSGKTEIALRLLNKFPDIDIISADSRQIYKHLNIGTDKPPDDVLKKYRFHLVDIVEPGQRYTAFDFVEDTERLLGQLTEESSCLPFICGGTGLYIKSLVEGITEIPDDDFSIRNRLEDEAVEHGPKFLFNRLRQIDPIEAKKVHPNNIKRVIRALEIYYLTGLSKSDIIARAAKKKADYNYYMVCYLPPREKLYEKINKRVDLMIKAGLLDEVEKLCEMGIKEQVESINVIGYNELFKYFDGELSLESAVNLIKQNTRRFAKRQITWFKGMKNLTHIGDGDEIFKRFMKFWGNEN